MAESVAGAPSLPREFVEYYLREIGVRPVSAYLDQVIAARSHATRAAVELEPVATAPVPASAVQATMAGEEANDGNAATAAVSGVEGPTLESLKQQASGCCLCPLAEQRRNVVFGSGSADAELVFIGEAPGQEEDRQGLPFVGPAGQLLDRMLAAIGLNREQVYIMNTIKCRPPNNRDPKPEEVEACHVWFEQQLALLKPRALCLLGRVAAQTLLQNDEPLGRLRGRWHDYHGIPVRVTYHPAYLLRSPAQKRKSWEDLLALNEVLSAGLG